MRSTTCQTQIHSGLVAPTPTPFPGTPLPQTASPCFQYSGPLSPQTVKATTLKASPKGWRLRHNSKTRRFLKATNTHLVALFGVLAGLYSYTTHRIPFIRLRFWL